MKKRLFLLLLIFCISARVVFSQPQTSKDNYTGAWETPASWNPTWTVPLISFTEGIDITINGYITVNGSLSFSGTASNLIINDTLVIKGDLLLESSSNLTVNGNGILIVRGNLTLDGNPNIITNNYIVITGYIWKLGSTNNGSFISNSNPTKVFVGAYVYPTALTNKPNFPALNCTAPTTTPYLHSNCSYGDKIDLINDPINTFLQSICTITAAITINDNSGIANNDGIICNGDTATLTASGGISYIWSSGETTAAIVKDTAGTYTVTVTNTKGCTDTKAATLIVNALPATPTITAGNPTAICAGESVILTSSTEASYLWSTGATSASITVSTAGSYTVQVTNASGCESAVSAATEVTINALPITPIITAGGPTTFCAGESVTLTSSAGTSYLWSNGATPPSIYATTTGNYTVRVSNASGCHSAASAAIAVTVNALPVATASNNGPVCMGSTLNLTGGPAGMTTYSWTGPNGFTSSAQNPSITNANTAIAGAYTITVTAATGCTVTNTTNVIVNENPVAIAGPDQVLKFVFETQMNAKLSPSETGEWSLISGSGRISNIHSPTTRITELSGGENIFLWKVRNGSCEAAAEVKITVYDPFIPSVITPDGDGKNDYFKISEIIGQVELIIFNRWGNEEYTNSNYLNDWDGRNNKGVELLNDTYFYVLKFENGKIKKGSVLIKR